MNPFERLPGIPEPEVIEDASLGRASKKANAIPFRRSKLRTARERETARIRTLASSLRGYVERAARFGRVYAEADIFYRRLGDLLFEEEEISHTVSRIEGLKRTLNSLERRYTRRIRRVRSPEQAGSLRKEAYGRLVSVVKRRGDEWSFLSEVLEKLRSLPSLETDAPVVVVAGCPNSGKSTLVGAMTSAAPEKADYPFTTKGITVGHMAVDNFRVQMMDTPGLLDRPMDTRNKMELQAILCLEEVADVGVFLFDGGPARYYPMEQQVEMLREIGDLFPGLPVIPSLNKIDLEMIDFQALADSPYRNCLRISALRNTGLDDLKDKIADSLIHAGFEPSPFPQWKA